MRQFRSSLALLIEQVRGIYPKLSKIIGLPRNFVSPSRLNRSFKLLTIHILHLTAARRLAEGCQNITSKAHGKPEVNRRVDDATHTNPPETGLW